MGLKYQVLLENPATLFTLGICQVEKVVQNEGRFSVNTLEVYSCDKPSMFEGLKETHSELIPV